MSRFLLLLCLTLGLVVTGCGGDKKDDKDKGTQKTTDDDKKGSSAKGSTGKDDGKKDEGKKEDGKKEDGKKDDGKAEAKKDDKASAAQPSDAQLVSLKLPNMT